MTGEINSAQVLQWVLAGLLGLLTGAVLMAVYLWPRGKRSAARVQELEKENARLLVIQESEQIRHREMRDTFEAAQKASAEKFEFLAQKIFQENSSQFREQGEKQMKLMLEPVKERLKEFEKKVEETYQSESRERFSLKEEIRRIVDMNQKMSLETQSLTKALRGDVKSQGRWGELVLERILERSGLRAGEEYVTQGSGLDLKTATGTTEKPDIVIRLPEDKHIIVDSKVSLTSYDRFINLENPAEKELAKKEFLNSLYKHVEGLAQKHYHMQEKLRSPDFVLLFMPTESSFSVAHQSDPELFGYAWDRRIVLVSPTTLLATLRTVESIWKQERQSKNAVEIARQGGALYDKFVLFVEDLEELGGQIDKTHSLYVSAMGKLRDGKGNLLRRAENLKELGAKTTKQLEQSSGNMES